LQCRDSHAKLNFISIFRSRREKPWKSTSLAAKSLYVPANATAEHSGGLDANLLPAGGNPRILTFDSRVGGFSMFNLENFAAEHNLKTKRDSCGEPLIVPGNPRRSEDVSHVYEHSEGVLGLVLLYDTPTLWHNAKKRLTGLGFTVHQDGETEGILLFDPTNTIQVQAAIKTAGLKKHRRFSETGRTALLANIQKARTVRQAQCDVMAG
jgi:hypothetical protein